RIPACRRIAFALVDAQRTSIGTLRPMVQSNARVSAETPQREPEISRLRAGAHRCPHPLVLEPTRSKRPGDRGGAANVVEIVGFRGNNQAAICIIPLPPFGAGWSIWPCIAITAR